MSSLERVLPFEAAPFLPGGRFPSPVARAVKAGERVFLSGSGAQKSDGSIAGLGDPAAQAEAALDNIEAALAGAGRKTRGHHEADDLHRRSRSSQAGLRGYRPALKGVFPVSTGLVVAGLPMVEQMVQIDADAVIGSAVQRIRKFEMKNWFDQDIAWQGSMIAAGEHELFIRGQTGSALDGSHMAGLGQAAPRMRRRRPSSR